MACISDTGLCGNTTKEIPEAPLISDELMWRLNVYMFSIVSGGFAVIGTIGNFINFIIFYQLGLKDSMSVCLFALAVTDATQSFLVLASRTFLIWNAFFSTDEIDPMAINYVVYSWVADGFFLVCGWITAYLAMERCICVNFPFKVKQIFTRNRAIVAMIIIYIVASSVYYPIHATHWLGWDNVELHTSNETSFGRKTVVKYSADRKEIENYVEILSVTVIPIPSFALILGSVLWMIYGLKLSSEKRSSMMAKNTDPSGSKQDSGMTNKTRRLVIVVLIVAIIFIICSIPRLYGTLYDLVHPEVAEDGRDRNYHIFLWQFVHFAAAVNASINIFVYLKINSSYRKKFREIFQLASK